LASVPTELYSFDVTTEQLMGHDPDGTRGASLTELQEPTDDRSERRVIGVNGMGVQGFTSDLSAAQANRSDRPWSRVDLTERGTGDNRLGRVSVLTTTEQGRPVHHDGPYGWVLATEREPVRTDLAVASNAARWDAEQERYVMTKPVPALVMSEEAAKAKAKASRVASNKKRNAKRKAELAKARAEHAAKEATKAERPTVAFDVAHRVTYGS